jgi:hypothetical protein
MSSKRFYLGMLIIVALLLVGLVGVTYEVNSVLATRANKLVGLKAKDQALSAEQTSLTRAKKDISKYSALAQIAKSVVPQDKDQAQAVREIVNIAGSSGLSLASIAFPASTLGSTQAGVQPSGSSASSTSSAATALSQLKAVSGIPGVYELDITIASDPNKPVPFNQFIGFLQGLEQNRRTSQVSAISINPDAQNNALLSFTLTLQEYIKP